MFYITLTNNTFAEIVDAFDTRFETLKMLAEYRLGYPVGSYAMEDEDSIAPGLLSDWECED